MPRRYGSVVAPHNKARLAQSAQGRKRRIYTMINIHDVGSAFAVKGREKDVMGMTLRDWFAGRAIQSILTSEAGGLAPKADACREAYQYADAMLAARSETKP